MGSGGATELEARLVVGLGEAAGVVGKAFTGNTVKFDKELDEVNKMKKLETHPHKMPE